MYFNFGFRHRYYTLNDAHSLDEANFKRSGQAISMAAVEFTSTKFALNTYLSTRIKESSFHGSIQNIAT